MNVVQVGLIGVAGVLMAIYIKQEKGEIAIYLCIATSILIFLGIINHLEVLIETVKEISTFVNIDLVYIGTLFLFITIIAVLFLIIFKISASSLVKSLLPSKIAITKSASFVILLDFSIPILLLCLQFLNI